VVAFWVGTGQPLPTTNVSDLWIGFAGLAFTILVAALTLAYRLGRLTESVRSLKEDMGATEARVERMLMGAWIQVGREEWDRRRGDHE